MSRYAIDLAERVLGAYILAFAALILADGFDFTNLGALKAAALAAVPAAISVIKGFLARKFFSSDDSASFFL